MEPKNTKDCQRANAVQNVYVLCVNAGAIRHQERFVGGVFCGKIRSRLFHGDSLP